MSPGAWSGLAACLLLMLGSVAAPALEKFPVGWIERVQLYPGKVELSAKLDTGADTSSLDAKSLKPFVREGRDWISFEISGQSGKNFRFEKPVVRTGRIRRHGGKIEERPVVVFGVCLGNVYVDTEVNLVDRRGLDYPMLIGRSFMASRVVVDPSRSNIVEPACVVPAAAQ